MGLRLAPARGFFAPICFLAGAVFLPGAVILRLRIDAQAPGAKPHGRFPASKILLVPEDARSQVTVDKLYTDHQRHVLSVCDPGRRSVYADYSRRPQTPRSYCPAAPPARCSRVYKRPLIGVQAREWK